MNNTSLIKNAADAKKQASAKPKPGALMQQVINAGMRAQFEDVLKDKSGPFIASLIDLYASDSYLAQCDPAKVCLEALKAATLDLPINKQLGFAWIVPYRENGVQTPHFQIGYRGLLQLAQRTGAYRYINAGAVYEGMDVETDWLTGAVTISGNPASDKVIGYFAYIETLNGFVKAEYWTIEKVRAHAKKFSKSYSNKSSAWASDFDAMAVKTVLRNLLSRWGYLSVQMQQAMAIEGSENDTTLDGEIIAHSSYEVEMQEAGQVIDAETGEVSGGLPFSEMPTVEPEQLAIT